MTEPLHIINAASTSDLTMEIFPAISSLEEGKVIYFPNLAFQLQDHEQLVLNDAILHPKHKNVSYDHPRRRLSGVHSTDDTLLHDTVQVFIQRFAEFARELIDTLLPQYTQSLQWGRTSYRPAEIKGRKTSKRKDDTRLHVDSFPATPVQGLRILRVFSNINPNGEPRVWHLGEPLPKVISTFADEIPTYQPFKAKVLHWLKATKTRRSPYDHYMLQLHDRMKLDDEYQKTVPKHRMEFPPMSTWIVFTDQVSHAALSGQFLLEQTFYLPVSAMVNSSLSPLKLWEQKRTSILV
jgi:hypothetical protein